MTLSLRGLARPLMLVAALSLPTASVAQGEPRSALALFEHAPFPGGIAIVDLGVADVRAPEARFDDKVVAVVEQRGIWHAVVGIALDVEAGAQTLDVRTSDGDRRRVPFEVMPREYDEQRITLTNRRQVNPGEAELRRIRREGQKLARSRAYRSDTLLADRFIWPVKGPMSSPFGLRRFFNDQPRRPHGGVDIAVPEGTPIVAPADGIVIDTGEYFFNGNSVFLAHGLGLQTFHAHLSRIDVAEGDRVSAGDVIGAVGATGRVTGPHLHWSISLNNEWVDPLLFVDESALTP